MVSRRYEAMKHRKGYIRHWQVRKLINYFKAKAKENTDSFSRWKSCIQKALLVYVLWKTGRRVSELVGMPYEQSDRVPGFRPIDIDFENKDIAFSILKKFPVKSKDKGGNERSPNKIAREKLNKPKWDEAFVYDDKLFSVLKYWIPRLDIPKHERIFPFDRIYVDQFLKEAGNNLGLSLPGKKIIKEEGVEIEKKHPISAHSFRHGFAINFLEKNPNDPAALAVLQEILSHSDISVTKGYLKFDQKKKRQMLNVAAEEDEE